MKTFSKVISFFFSLFSPRQFCPLVDILVVKNHTTFPSLHREFYL